MYLLLIIQALLAYYHDWWLQGKDIKEIKEKEAVVTALSRDNELIKSEVLLKLQEQRDAAEASAVTTAVTIATTAVTTAPEEPSVKQEETIIETKAEKSTDETKKVSKRRHQVEKPAAIQPADDRKKEPQKSTHDYSDVIKSFHYKNFNYKKFFSEDKAQPKLKFKKS